MLTRTQKDLLIEYQAENPGVKLFLDQGSVSKGLEFQPKAKIPSEGEVKKTLEGMEEERYGGMPRGFTDQELCGRPEELARQEREEITGQKEFQFQPKISELRDKAKRGLDLTQEERTLLANSTSRDWNKLTVSAQTLADKVKPTEGSVLDFGAGKNAIQTKLLRDRGYDVTAYEFGENVNPQLHDRDALAKRYATVMASNVLNVQSSPEMFRGTVQDMANALAEGGKVIANFPATPRYLDQTAPPRWRPG